MIPGKYASFAIAKITGRTTVSFIQQLKVEKSNFEDVATIVCSEGITFDNVLEKNLAFIARRSKLIIPACVQTGPKQDIRNRLSKLDDNIANGKSTITQIATAITVGGQINGKEYSYLPTVSATVGTSDGFQSVSCRFLLKSSSQVSYISENLVRQLKLNAAFDNGHKVVEVQLKLPSGGHLTVKAHVMPMDISTIYRAPFDLNWIAPLYRQLNFADTIPMDFEQAAIDLLIGSDYYFDIVTSAHANPMKGLHFIGSEFGWIRSGRIQPPSMVLDQVTSSLVNVACPKRGAAPIQNVTKLQHQCKKVDIIQSQSFFSASDSSDESFNQLIDSQEQFFDAISEFQDDNQQKQKRKIRHLTKSAAKGKFTSHLRKMDVTCASVFWESFSYCLVLVVILVLGGAIVLDICNIDASLASITKTAESSSRIRMKLSSSGTSATTEISIDHFLSKIDFDSKRSSEKKALTGATETPATNGTAHVERFNQTGLKKIDFGRLTALSFLTTEIERQAILVYKVNGHWMVKEY